MDAVNAVPPIVRFIVLGIVHPRWGGNDKSQTP
jgi:hypothetical protein